jgi:FkbM family methyltransferase
LADSPARSFAMPPEDVVQALYKHMLRRRPNASEIEAWSALMRRHDDPTVLMQGILGSDEYGLVNRSVSLKTRKLFFFHNPKAAGLSITHAIKAATGEEAHAPEIANNLNQHEALAGQYDRFKGHDIYTGHYGRDVFEAVRDGHPYITNFRHPVRRVLSLYNYFKDTFKKLSRGEGSAAYYAACEAAATMSLHDFVMCDRPAVRVFVNDFHFRQLTSTPWEFRDPATLESAYRFIDGALCYYVCEFEDLSRRWLSERLGLESLPHDNTSHDKAGSLRPEQIPDDTVQAILDLNTRDLAIYRYAVQGLLGRNAAPIEVSQAAPSLGGPVAEAASSGRFAMSAEDVVQALYRNLLGREADPDGLEGWSNLIRQHQDPSFALKWIMDSDEYRQRQPPEASLVNEFAALALARLGRKPRIVDVGAQTLGPGSHAYDALMRFCPTEVVGFDPLQERLEERRAAEGGENVTLLPYALGDGGAHTLHVNNADATSSLFPLDQDHNRPFPLLSQLETVSTIVLPTRRLDEVIPPDPVDFLKLDVQGGELMVLEHAKATLARTAVVHCEVEFGPIYAGQPLFSDVETFLRAHDFYLVDFPTLGKYAYENKRNFETADQLLWADAVFFRRTEDRVVRAAQALIAATVYRKPSLASHLLEA